MTQQTRNLKGQRFERFATFDRASVDAEARTVRLAFATETPVDRGWGMEVLDCDSKSVRMKRLMNGAAVLREHDRNQHIGVVESASIDSDKVGRAVVRIGKSKQAEEAWQDIADGILRHVSVGYAVHSFTTPPPEDKTQTYRVTDWEPMEITMCAVPADPECQVGRTDEPPVVEPVKTEPQKTEPTPQQETRTMADQTTTTAAAPTVDREQILKDERARSENILAMGKKHGMELQAEAAVKDGTPVDVFRAAVLDKLGAKQVQPVDPIVGMTDKEVKRYSLFRAVRALDTGIWKDAGFELELSQEIAKRSNKSPTGIFMPLDVIVADAMHKRTANNKTTDSEGGYLVGTTHAADMFVEMLRNENAAFKAGCRTLPGLLGNLVLPTQTGGATCYYLGEQTDVTESSQTWGQVSMSPKTIAAESRITRSMLLQSSPSVEALVRQDLMTVMGEGINLGIFQGTGTTQPTGIVTASAAYTVDFSSAPTFAKLVDMETKVATAKALRGSLAYVGGAAFAGKCKQTQKFSSTNGQPILENGMINGYPFYMDTNITTTQLFFGNFSDVLVGFWSGLDIRLDKSAYAKQDGLMILAFQDYDVGIRHAASFALSSGMTVA